MKTTCGTARSSAVAACRPHRPSSTASPFARHDDVADGSGLVLALVGQQYASVDVTGGVQPPITDRRPVLPDDPQGVVDRESGARLQAAGVQANVLGVRRAADRDEEFVGLDRLTGRTDETS
ncbi:hypothetical protein [Thermomonospora echinospora]|uniref:hypothetical protein n=1 Tax=Thermomonospora echinospora TaxID=1992 RepID=UPI00190EBC84|nr:hypothetical protein [Thermomonospora echinospora]